MRHTTRLTVTAFYKSAHPRPTTFQIMFAGAIQYDTVKFRELVFGWLNRGSPNCLFESRDAGVNDQPLFVAVPSLSVGDFITISDEVQSLMFECLAYGWRELSPPAKPTPQTAPNQAQSTQEPRPLDLTKDECTALIRRFREVYPDLA